MSGDGGGRHDRRGFLPFLALLLALVAAWLGRALAGDLFVSTELVWNSVEPWSGVGPAAPLHNPNLADPPTIWWPFNRFSAALLRDWIAGGPPPLWTYECYAGAPWFGNPQSALLSPFTWAFVVLPEVAAFAAVAALKWLLAGIGAWLLARRYGASPLARGVAGVAFAFCGYQVVWISSPLSNVSVLAPWLLLALLRLVERPDGVRTAVAALVSWQVVVAGHPETAFWIALLGVVVAAGEWVALRESRGRALAALLAAAALAAGMAVVQWWPFLEYALSSYGNELRRAAPRWFARPFSAAEFAWLIPAALTVGFAVRARRCVTTGRFGAGAWFLSALCGAALGVVMRRGGLQGTLLLQLLPDWFGRSLVDGAGTGAAADGAALLARYHGPFTYCDVVGGFAGAALGLVASAAALTMLTCDRRVAALVSAVLLVGARGARVPGLADLADAHPALSTIGSSRALAVLGLAIALLGALGLDRLRAMPRQFLAALLVPLAFAAAVASTPIAKPERADDQVAAGAELEAPPRLAARPGELGATFRGLAPARAVAVAIRANGAPAARVALPAAVSGDAAVEAGVGTPFQWCFLLSDRLEEGWLTLTFSAIDAAGAETPFATVTRSTERPFRLDLRALLPLCAVLLVLLAAAAGRGQLAAWLLLLLTVTELAWFGARYQATTPVERIPGAVEPIPFLMEQRVRLGPHRLFTARTHLHPSLNLPLGVEVLRGYDSLEPLSYVRLLDELAPGRVVPWVQMDFSTLDFAGARGRAIADVLGVRWFLSAEAPPPGFREVWRRGTLALWENESALPRAFAVTAGTTLREAVARGLDPRATACWDDAADAAPELEFPGRARVVEQQHGRGRMRAAVESDAGAIVVFSENHGGWQATLDGAPVAIRRTHMALQSVVVPVGGRHEVEFLYRPRSVVWGAGISAGALLVTLAVALAGWRRRRAAVSPTVV